MRRLRQLFSGRVRALMRKEFNQIRRDRRLAISLILPPTLQLLLFGFALSANVSNLRLGIVDDSKTPESRELIATMSESKSFRLAGYYFSVDELGDAISLGDLDAGVVIPYDFARELQRGRSTTLQVLLNAMNANTAAIGQGYAEGVIQSYNRQLLLASRGSGPRPTSIDVSDKRESPVRSAQSATPNRQLAIPNLQPAIEGAQTAIRPHQPGLVSIHPAFLYNPGLVDSWFIATGVFGLLLILNSSLVASGAMVKEREAGTIEQLLMSPSSTSEIVIAKITPLFVLLCMMSLLALATIKLAFGVPFHGNLLLVLAGAALCILSGISLGTVISTFSKSAQQALLTSFFVNPPLATLSGAFNPVEAMPKWLQPLTVINPIHHFGTIVRGTLLKGSGLADLWPNFGALLAFTIILFSLSMWRFRKQLA
ncbi:MAG TPA: ABC transporter permease [Blastocatellia bacterium]